MASPLGARSARFYSQPYDAEWTLFVSVLFHGVSNHVRRPGVSLLQ